MERAPTVTLYVRSLSPPGLRSRQVDIIERLADCEANRTVDEYSVEVWGRQVPTADDCRSATSRRVHERIESFREWAATHGRALEPLFTTETIRSRITAEAHTRVVLPAMTLVEYVDDEIRFISPSTDGETVTTVADRLDRLDTTARDELVTDGGRESVTAASDGEQSRYQRLFVDITGSEVVVSEQEVAVPSRDIDEDMASIAAYVTAVAKKDGLADTIDESESSQRD